MERSGVLTALAVASFLTLVFAAENLRTPVALVVFVTSLTAGAYGVDRLVGADIGTGLRALGLSLVLSSLVAATVAAWSLAGSKLLAVALVVVCSVLIYAFPLFPGARRVKDIPFVKPFYVGAVWMFLFFACLPRLSVASALTLCLVFVRVVLGSIASDVKDIDRDRQEGVKTFPSHFGRAASLRALVIAHLCVAAAYVAGVSAGILPLGVLLGGVDAFVAALFLKSIAHWRSHSVSFGTEILVEASALGPFLWWLVR